MRPTIKSSAHVALSKLLWLACSTVVWAQPDVGASKYGLISAAQYADRMEAEVLPMWNATSTGPRAIRGELKGVDGVPLAYASVVLPNERGAVVIVTGRTENLLKYQEVIADLARQRYSVYVYDHRGQGFSGRLIPGDEQKGHVETFDDYTQDLQAFVREVVNKVPHRHLMALGHSMGGAVLTRHLQLYPGVFGAAVLSSPMHQPNAKILFSADTSCAWFRWTGWAFRQSWAGFSRSPYEAIVFDDPKNKYSHSRDRWARVLKVEAAHPEVQLGGPTRAWVAEACEASDLMLSDVGRIQVPVLVLQAGGDELVMNDAQDQFCERLGRVPGRSCDGGRPFTVAGARHELLIEDDRYRVPAMDRIMEFLDANSSP